MIEESRNTPSSVPAFARSIAAVTDDTLPVRITYDFPHMPFASLTSIRSTSAVLAAVSAATTADAAVKVSIMPMAPLFFTSSAPQIAG